MRYRETSPDAQLRPWVDCLWELQGITAEPQLIYPDGRSEIVIHLGEPFLFNGSPQARSLIAGQLTSSIVLQPSGAIHAFGIRFAPAGAWTLLKLDPRAVLNTVVPAH